MSGNPRRCGEQRCCRCGKKPEEAPRYPVRFEPAACKGEKLPFSYQHTICETCYPAFRVEQEVAALASSSHEDMSTVM